MSISDLARPEIRALRPYAPARQLDGSIRMNANESPWTEDDRASPSLNRYPPVRPWALRDRLAGIYGVDAGSLLVTRGSSEAIDLLVRVFCRPGVDNVLLAPPTFGMYRVYAEIQGAGIRAVPMHSGENFAFDVAGLLRAVDANSRLLFLCSPNNPTGNALDAGQLEALLEAAIGRFLVVIDEAYAEFSALPSCIRYLDRCDNLVVLRTLSKAWGLAGARLGAVVARPQLIDMLDTVLAPYAVSSPAAECALRALQDCARARGRIAQLRQERRRLALELAGSPLVEKVWPSEANFLLVRFRDAATASAQLDAGRILIRDMSHEPGLAGCARITVGSREENDALLRVIGTGEDAA